MGILSFLGLSKESTYDVGWLLPPETTEDKMLRLGERVAVLDSLIHSYRNDLNVCVDTKTETFIGWVQELAILRCKLRILTGKQEEKERSVVERLQMENSRLLADLVDAENRYQRDVYGLNNEGDSIGGEPPSGFYNDAQRYKALWEASLLPEVKHSELVLGKYYWEFEALHFPIVIQWNGDPFGRGTKGLRFFGPILPPELPSEEANCANAS